MSVRFRNRPNKKVKTENGETVYISRACAVVAEIFVYSVCDKSWYVLLGKRGEKVPNYKGYWGFPCGYLDWDETLFEATCREVWEETGLMLTDLRKQVNPEESYNLHIDGKLESPIPWKITDKPDGERQNVSFHYGIIFSWKYSELPLLSIENSDPGEADEATWVNLEKAFSLDMAFNHTSRLKEIWLEEKERFKGVVK